MSETSAAEKQLAAEKAAASSDDAKKAAEKRGAALGLRTTAEPTVDSEPKARKQTTR